MVPKAYSYARFSSLRQADGHSLERQLAIAREWYTREIAPLGLPLDDLKCDDGYSAYRGQHVAKGSLGHFLAEIKEGNIAKGSVLIAENLDRISRQGPKIARKIIEQVVDNGVDIHICNISVKLTYGWENDHARSIIVDVELGRAFRESEAKSERIGRAWASKREKARQGKANRSRLSTSTLITRRVPAWLTAEGEAIPEHAATVQRIFRLAGAGMGCKRIVGILTDEGRAPFFKGGKQGRKWTPEYVLDILKSRSVLGEYTPHKTVDGKRVPEGEPIPDYYPAIVTQSEFDAAQESIKAKTRYVCKDGGAGFRGGRDKANSLFTPLVYDADHEEIMVFHRKRGGAPYLTTRYTDGKKKAHRFRSDLFESLLLNFFEDLDWPSIAGEGEPEEVKAARAELDAVLAEIDRSSRKIEGMQALVEEGSFSRSLFEALDSEKAKQSDATSRKEKLAAGLAMARSKAAALLRPEELIEAIHSGTDPEMRLRLKTEIKKRIKRIDMAFDMSHIDDPRDRLDYCIYVHFSNDVPRAIGIKDGKALLVKLTGDLEMLDRLEAAREVF
jgi:DNA invertase Pin-like site-specific DNA recombinase